jgi:beta-glucosidase-like glycosyl hydrolase
MIDQNQLLAQSIFPRLNCSQYRTESAYSDRINGMIASRSVGGFVLFDGDVETVQLVTADLARLSEGDLLMAADCEDGVTMRFPGGTEFPSMMALGRSGDVAATYSVARSIAREMRALGIYWNFAPVADINTNPDNPIINIRAFGEQADEVSDHVHAYAQGMQDGGVVACVKHFPGHGDTRVDSHLEMPVIAADRRRLDSVELLPFRQAIRNGVKSVMVSHIAVPAIDPEGLPATLSAPITNGLLRQDLGFEGVVVTDALDMHAISHRYPAGEAAWLAYNAGCDVLSIPEDPDAALAALRRGLAEKKIKGSRVKASWSRIAAIKKWTSGYADDVQQTTLTRRGHDVIALEAARRSIQVMGRMRRIVPPLLVLALADTAENPKPGEWFTYFSSWYSGEASGVVVTPEVDEADRDTIVERIDSAGTVIVAMFVKPRGFAGTVGLSPDQQMIVDRSLGRSLVLLNFGNPYLLRDAEPNVRVDTFSASSASLAASIEALGRAIK